MGYLEYEPINYKTPDDLCCCEDAQTLYLVSPAVREIPVVFEEGTGRLLGDFATDYYDDGDGASYLRCSQCGKKWELEIEPIPTTQDGPSCLSCNDTGILLMSREIGDLEGNEREITYIERCDECAIFPTDEDAASALQSRLYKETKQ